jgi:methionyl-tRNA formyltransferase
MNLVVLCKSWNHGKVLEILAALRQQDLRVRGIVALAAPPKKNNFSDFIRKTHERGVANILSRFFFNGVAHNVGMNEYISANGADSALNINSQNGKLHQNSDWHSQQSITKYAQRHQIEMAVVPDLNGDACVTALQRMETDILLLGGAPIIRANVLAMPKLCTLNVHMALLPQFRGMNVAEWSIFCGAPVGVTVHQVDPGVDTGAILYREVIKVADCSNIETMRAKVSRQQHLILGKCARLLVEKKLVPEPQQKEDGKQYYVMHGKLRKIVEHRLAKGYARESF